MFTILLFNINLYSYNNDFDKKTSDNDSIQISQSTLNFIESHSFTKLYLVFAGPYPSSPTSSFGHIFILLKPKSEKPFLLWDAIDFSADISNYSTLEFFYRGIFSSLEGKYKIIPFYEKLREYTFIESRPLWLFEIEMTENESFEFLAEVNSKLGKEFKYKFSNANCASEIYRLIIDTKNQNEKISNSLVLPNNIIKNLNKYEGMYIESIYEHLEKIKNFIDVNNTNKSSFLQNRLTFLEWKYTQQNALLDSNEMAEISNLRKDIATSDKPAYNNLIAENKDFSMHPSMNTKIGFTNQSGLENFLNIGYRFGIHNFFESFSVYPKNDYLELFKIDFSFNKSKLILDNLLLFDQTSLQPISFLSSPASWKLGFGMKRKSEFKDRKLASGLFLAYGYSFSILDKFLSLSLLLNTEPIFFKIDQFNLLFGTEAIIRFNYNDRLKLLTSIKCDLQDLSDIKYLYRFDNSLAYRISDKYIIFLNINQTMFNQDYGIQIKYYFD